MPRTTRSGKSAAVQAPEITKTRKAPAAAQKGKETVEEAETQTPVENVMEEVPAWAKALRKDFADQIDALGDYVESRLANMEKSQTRENPVAGVIPEIVPEGRNQKEPGIVVREAPFPRVPVMDESEK